MYDTIEIFNEENNSNLKDILKCCIYKYYLKNKDKICTSNYLQSTRECDILNTTRQEVLSRKEIVNV